MKNTPLQTEQRLDPFYQKFKGSFTSYMRWADLDQLWQKLQTDTESDWYIYAIGEAVPEKTVSKQQLDNFIHEINALLHNDHEEEYCGIVYADDKSHPGFIKIFDPNNLGVSCGFSDDPPLPGWIISTLPPKPLEDKSVLTQQRKRWWQKLWQK